MPKDKFIVRVCKKLKPIFPSEAMYLKARFRLEMGYRLDLKNPKTFSEKLQWLKLYNRRPEYTTMVDKYAVKDYVAKKIGSEFVIPTLGVWDTPEEIEWDKLPDRFVLKTTHGGGSGGVVICKDKATINKRQVIEKLRLSLRQDIAYYSCEWPYKNVPRRIIAEEYLDPSPNLKDLYDYKFFCFDGEVKFFKIDFDRQTNHHANYYDRNGVLLPFGEALFPPKPEKEIEIPSNLQEMIDVAEKLSKGEPFCRVDLYDIKEKIYFGEVTLFPASGFEKYTPEHYDEIIGKMLTLKEKRLGGAIINLKKKSEDRIDSSFDLEILKPDLLEYKLFCFDGKVRFLKVNMGRTEGLHINFYNTDFEFLPFGEAWYPPNPQATIKKPENFDKMISIAEQLSAGIPLLRVDLYNVNGIIYFGELTFFPASGMENYEPAEWDRKIGDMLVLPNNKCVN